MKNLYGLEPCPYCDTSVVSCEFDGNYIWVECGNAECRASLKAVRLDTGNADEAKRLWNTRPIEDALRAQLAEKEVEIERLMADKQALMLTLQALNEFHEIGDGDDN